MEPTTTKKSFLSKPENKTALLIGIPALAAGIYGFSLMLPWLIALTTNTITLIGLVLVLGAILYVLADKRNWALAWYAYRTVCRWITGIVVNIDPIAIMKSYAGALTGHYNDLCQNVSELQGSICKLEENIKNNLAAEKQALAEARAAKKRGADPEAYNALRLAVRQAERYKESNKKLISMHAKLVKLYQWLSKLRSNTKFMLADFNADIAIKEDELKSITSGYRAMNSAMKVIDGDSDKKEIFDMACESLANDMAMKSGSIQDQIEMSKEFMTRMDLLDDIAMEKGMALLEEKGADLLAYTPSKVDSVEIPEGTDEKFVPAFLEHEESADEYKELLTK